MVLFSQYNLKFSNSKKKKNYRESWSEIFVFKKKILYDFARRYMFLSNASETKQFGTYNQDWTSKGFNRIFSKNMQNHEAYILLPDSKSCEISENTKHQSMSMFFDRTESHIRRVFPIFYDNNKYRRLFALFENIYNVTFWSLIFKFYLPTNLC